MYLTVHSYQETTDHVFLRGKSFDEGGVMVKVGMSVFNKMCHHIYIYILHMCMLLGFVYPCFMETNVQGV